jgi:hypothetical protein
MRTLLIPVELCEYVLKHKISKPFQLYILLKSRCDGKMRLPQENFDAIADILHRRSGKTIQNNLKKLRQLNWIGYNKKSRMYFIRGFEFLQRFLKMSSRTAAEFDINDICQIQAFLAAAVIGYLVNQQRKKRWMLGSKKGGPKQSVHTSSDYDKVATSLIASKLKVSLSTAHSLKQMAKKAGYISIVSHFDHLDIDPRAKNMMKKAVPEYRARIRVDNGTLALQQADEIIPQLRFKKRKKIEAYKKG